MRHGKISVTRDLMIVEDDLLFLEVIRMTLEPRVVRIAHTMKEALAMIDESAPEILLLDLKLPDSPPDQTLARIRDIKKRAHDALIVIVTGYADQKHQDQAMKEGADLFLSKDDAAFYDRLSEGFRTSREPQQSAAEDTLQKMERIVSDIINPPRG